MRMLPYFHLWPAPLKNIFPHYLINGTIFGKKLTEHKMYTLIFCTTFVWSISHSKKNWARYNQKLYIGLHVKYRLLLSDFSNTWIFSNRFSKNPEKYRKSWENSSSESGGVPCGRTDRYEETIFLRTRLNVVFKMKRWSNNLIQVVNIIMSLSQ
jgi:hypothetical protein